MKKQTFTNITMLGLALVMTAVSVRAQSERSKVTNIPFDFTVGQKTLPAGEYTVEPRRRDSDNVWLVESKDGRVSVLFTTMSVRSSEEQETSKLIFHKYGNRYFLSQIWGTGDQGGRELLISRPERELAKKAVERKTIVLASSSSAKN